MCRWVELILNDGGFDGCGFVEGLEDRESGVGDIEDVDLGGMVGFEYVLDVEGFFGRGEGVVEDEIVEVGFVVIYSEVVERGLDGLVDLFFEGGIGVVWRDGILVGYGCEFCLDLKKYVSWVR